MAGTFHLCNVVYRCVEEPLESLEALTNLLGRLSCVVFEELVLSKRKVISDASPESQLSADLSPGANPPVSNFTRPTLCSISQVSWFLIVAWETLN